MKETQTFFPQDLYIKHLSTINNIHFTTREIDVMACLLSARRTSKTAFFLSIDARTVETHIRNIMSKIGCNTREGIIDFIEASDKLPLLRKYYFLLRIDSLFKKSLKDIAKLNQGNDLCCFLLPRKEKVPLIAHLRSHLDFAGITVSNAARKKDRDYVIFVLPKPLTEEDTSHLQKMIQSPNKILFLLQERKNHKEIPQELMDLDVVDFAKQENYYFSFFTILKKLLPNLNLDKIITEFKDKYNTINPDTEQSRVTSNERRSESRFFYQTNDKFLLSILFFVGLLSAGFFAFHWGQGKESYFFRSDLIVPTESIFLNRSELINQIDEKLKRQDDIQTVALVGSGGAGKTTLARQYARQQKTDITCEINAETPENIKRSFEQLAQNLSKTKKDKNTLREILEIKNPSVKEEKIIEFVKMHLKLKPNWLLIYDNVEEFGDIQKHFPLDSQTWGQGKVLLCSRNTNIQNNSQIGHVIPVGELTSKQKFDLFTKIMHRGFAPALTVAQNTEIQNFLEHIPSFPLDVSVAAYYIKSTNISYDNYLENLKNYNNEFASIQKSLLKEAGNYLHTRYGIITLSVEQLLKSHKDFGELLLFIGMLDSQNIPRDLLRKHKSDIIIDNFVYHLKKYSLINNNSVDAASNLTYSIHISTQKIILSHISKKLNLSDNKKFENKETLQRIHDTFSNYIVDAIERGDFLSMEFLSRHCNAWLSHKYLLTDLMQASISGELGGIYCHQGLYEKAKKLIENSLAMLNKEKNPILYAHVSIYLGKLYIALGDYEKAANLFENNLVIYNKYSIIHRDLLKTLTYLGTIYRKIGNYTKAQELLEKCFALYKSHFSDNPVLIPWTSIGLGNLYLDQGKFEKAKVLFENNLRIYKKHFPENHIAAAEIHQRLGVIYRALGHYEKAIEQLENSIKSYKKDLSENHLYVASPLVYLGSVYIELGEYNKAKEILEKGLKIYNKYVSKNHVLTAPALGYLGNVYKNLKDYQLAKDYLQKKLSIYEDQYGKNHIKTADVLRDLGKVYLLEEDTQTAENLLNTALRIFKKNEHPESYTCFESLSDLYQKKYEQALAKNLSSDAQHFNSQRHQLLKQALDIVSIYFLDGSPHRLRIQDKIKEHSPVGLR